ncbi:MAG: NAD+ synthase [Chlorobi bacterium]|nr:NAD+ synthase [Chlorobiota bacterium]
MKIALAQINLIIGDFEGNAAKHIRLIEEARRRGADLIVFPELSITGYPPRDFLEFKDFVARANATLERLKPYSRDIAVIAGVPTVNPRKEGKDLFNSAVFLYEGRELRRQHKTLLPTYDIFDEARYFEPADEWKPVEFKGKKIALTICEDIWNLGNENPLYTVNPVEKFLPYRPDLLINISASPFDYLHAKERIRVLKANVRAYGLPIVYVNHTGAQTDLIFDGGSLVMTPSGTVYRELPFFTEALEIIDSDALDQTDREREKPEIPLIYRALVTGIRDYFGKIGLKSAVLGLSGGIDSAVTAVLAAEALGSSHVEALLMPSRYSSESSVKDALKLAENLGISAKIISIEKPFQAVEEELRSFFVPKGITLENIQPRLRMIYLMAFANQYGHILLNTSNKSELAVGYGTLYGDLAGGLSVLGDVYKTRVYELARYINRDEEIIPRNIIDKPPSAELKPDQKDTDTLPPYEILDPILYRYIEERKGPREIITEGFDPELVKRVLRMVNRNEFKRYQTAPVLRVTPKAFGMGRRMPIVAKYLE